MGKERVSAVRRDLGGSFTRHRGSSATATGPERRFWRAQTHIQSRLTAVGVTLHMSRAGRLEAERSQTGRRLAASPPQKHGARHTRPTFTDQLKTRRCYRWRLLALLAPVSVGQLKAQDSHAFALCWRSDIPHSPVSSYLNWVYSDAVVVPLSLTTEA